jgi:hypothetical protein
MAWWAVALWGCAVEAPVDARPRVTVVAGDTLGAIARAHGVTVEALMAENGLQSDLIEVGQVLVLPAGSPEPAAAPSIRRPRPGPASPKACLPPPTGADGEAGMAASAGLSPDDVRASLDAVGPALAACAPPGRSGQVDLVVVVDCTGVVRSVVPQGAPPADADVVGCLVEQLQRASFPAHALPDGERFVYPLTWAGP